MCVLSDSLVGRTPPDQNVLILVVVRPKWEGGEYEGDDRHRLNVLRLAVELGADYVDVELKVSSLCVFFFSRSLSDVMCN